MISGLLVVLQALFSLAALIYWTRRDDLESIAKEIQFSRSPDLLKGNYTTPAGRRERRSKAANWISVDTDFAWYFGFRSVVWGVGVASAIFLSCFLTQLAIIHFSGSPLTLHSFTAMAGRLFIALADAVSFDLFFLIGHDGEFNSPLIEARTSTFVFLLSEVLIVSAIIGYIAQSMVSLVLVWLFPVHVYWAATDSRDVSGRRGPAEKIIRFLMDFNK